MNSDSEIGNSPIMHLVCPPKFLLNLCFLFLLGITAVPREIENNGYAYYYFFLEGGGRLANKVHFVRCTSGEWIYPQNITFFASVILLGSVKISKTRYQWKDQSLLTLLLTNLLALTEWIQKGKHVSFHMERKRPKPSSKSLN